MLSIISLFRIISKDFIQGGHQDTHGRQGRFGLEIVISALGQDAAFAPTRKRPDFDGGLGIDGNTQGIGGAIGIVIDLSYAGEDGLGVRDFFWGLLLATFLGK